MLNELFRYNKYSSYHNLIILTLQIYFFRNMFFKNPFTFKSQVHIMFFLLPNPVQQLSI